MRRISSWRRSSVVGLPLSVVVSQLSATVGQMQTSPTIEPSGCGRANATTSVSPRRPVARRFRRCIAGAPSSVNSTRTSRAPSQASTRRATRSNVRSETRRLRGRLPVLADSATGLGVVDAVVVHAGQDADEFRLHHVDLLQRERRLIELSGAELGSYDVIDRFLDRLGCESLEQAQRVFSLTARRRDRGNSRPQTRAWVAIVFRARGPVTPLLGAV